jgi:predicted O-linked N-acetylglucosamine transferase (SPINDLY family)
MSEQQQDLLQAAVALHQQMRLDEAEAAYTQVLARDPAQADALQLLGALQLQRGRAAEAVEWIEKSLAVNPNKSAAHLNLAHALSALGRRDEALASYGRVIALKPDHPDAYYNRAATLNAMARFDEALTDYGHAIRLRPAWADAFLNRGNIHRSLRRYRECLADYEQAVRLRPDFAAAYNNAAGVLEETGHMDAALANYRRAVTADSGFAEAWYNLGNALGKQQRLSEALEAYGRAMVLQPNMEDLASVWLRTKQHLCAWHGADDETGNFLARVERSELSCTPLELLATPASPALQLHCAMEYGTRLYPPAAPLWTGGRYGHDKIRIGYFSSDFRNHATAYLMTGMIEQHDRSRFEITGLSWGATKVNDARLRIEAAFDRVIHVHDKTDGDVAALARSLEIDIAVDLKGFTPTARPGIFARRPAPVQVSYLGFPGTMGVPYIDYFIADPVLIPPEQRAHYSEQIVYLPDSYQVNDTQRPIAAEIPSRLSLGLPEKALVFCSFNHNWKLTPAVFDVWMRLLHAAPGSVLWLLEGPPEAMDNLRREAVARGIDPERLVFAPRQPLAAHLARHAYADVYLDTFYCNGHTTTSDALWAGAPVITWVGDTFAGRVSASLLRAVGLPELITTTWADYETLALALATDPGRRAALRAKLAANLPTCALFDTARFTRHMEAAYTRMWERAEAGLAPADMTISE